MTRRPYLFFITYQYSNLQCRINLEFEVGTLEPTPGTLPHLFPNLPGSVTSVRRQMHASQFSKII